MDLHKPKPIRSWREFLKEYAIIVLGVVTALVGEQMVEKLHDRSRATLARENIHDEIATNIQLMNRRKATESCVSHRLGEVDGLLAASKVQRPIWIGHPFTASMADGQYQSATQSGAVSLLPTQEQAGYAGIYKGFVQYYQAELEEQAAWGDLRILEEYPPNAAVLNWHLRSALQKARTQRWLMEASAWALRRTADAMGIKGKGGPITWPMQSACLPLHTGRADGERLVVQGRDLIVTFDEP